MKQNETENTHFTQKKEYKYFCKICDFNTCKQNDYKRHLMTLKHKNKVNETRLKLQCLCGENFNSRTTLWRHKKHCVIITNTNVNINQSSNNIINDDNNGDIHIEINEQTNISNLLNDKYLIVELLKQNNEFKQLLVDQNNKLIELAKEGKYITNNNNTTNNFNLNIFLNEKCKDAIDLMDFVDTLQLKLHDLEETGRLGYVEGISKIFMRGLQQLDIYKRPIHCSDLKREVLYIKDKNAWEKEDEDKRRLMNAIKVICNKNIKQIPEWQLLNPEYNDPDSKQNDRYMKLLFNAMSGSTEEEQASNMNKIIRNIAKAVVIDKSK